VAPTNEGGMIRSTGLLTGRAAALDHGIGDGGSWRPRRPAGCRN
jgi:hypothetical protein